jgi:glycogen(starch) synthase
MTSRTSQWLPYLVIGAPQGGRSPFSTAPRKLPCSAPCDLRLDLSKSYFRSDFLRRQFAAEGFDVSGLPVIHHGVRIPDRVFAMQDRPPSIMYAGRLSVEKGVHILLKALAHIADEFRGSGIVVTLAGATTATGDYARALRSLARECESAFRIQFLGRLSRKETQRRLAMHSVFAFPVLWDEPFSLSLLEAMANGLAIAACSTGGSSEVLCDGENALVVAREDPRAMGEALRRLLRDAGLRAKLASGALHTARSFELNRSVDRVDEYLGRWGPT